jgi:hypothetical protein
MAPSVVPSAASPPASDGLRRWTVSGVVRDADEGFVVGGVSVQLVDRFEPRTTSTDAAGRYAFTGVAESGVGMAFSRSGYRELKIEQVLPVKDLALDVAITRECTPRPAPAALSYSIAGTSVIFSWPALDSAQEYRLSVGQWDYVSPVFAVTTTSTTYEWVNAPPGTYHARVQGRNACGYGNAATELKVIVP